MTKTIQIKKKHPGDGNFFFDWWTLVGTSYRQRHISQGHTTHTLLTTVKYKIDNNSEKNNHPEKNS